MRTWITPVSLLANITVTMMVLGLLRKDRCDVYLDHPLVTVTIMVLASRCDQSPCLIVGQHHSHHDGVGVAKKGQV